MRSGTAALILTHRRQRVVWICLLLCLCFLLLDRWLILDQFAFRYVDDDQAILWHGAMEMAQGHFHEPCFYGQRYNTLLEGFVAVPLFWMGVGPNVALPLVTSLLALFPFVLLAMVLVRKQAYALAAFMLAFPVTLSPEFGMITAMPRGFVTGVFLASLAVLPLFSRRGVFLFLSPFFAILALFANPNAALVLAPAGLLILLQRHTDRRFYLLGAAGALPAAIIYYLGHHFYDVRSNYEVHVQWELDFTAADIRLAALHYLDEISPLLWGKGWSVFVLLGSVVVALGAARQWKQAIALFAGLLLLVVAFGINKVNDGVPSVFYPWARMFLAVPFLLALFVAQLKGPSHRWLLLLMPVLAAGFFGYKWIVQGAAVERQTAADRQKNMEVEEVRELRRQCLLIDQVARANQSRLMVIGWGRNKHLINYGCACLVRDFPGTLEPVLDRRTWWLQEVAGQVVPNVLFAGFEEDGFAATPPSYPKLKRVSQEPLLFLLKGNTLRTDTLLNGMRMGLRPY